MNDSRSSLPNPHESDSRSAQFGSGQFASARVVALVILGVTLIGGAVLVGGTLLGLRRGQMPLTVRPEDREVLVTAADLVPFAPDLLVRTDGESTRRFRTIDGRYVLRYEYEHPDPTRELGIVCEIIVEPTEEAAAARFADFSARLTPSGDSRVEAIGFRPEETGWEGEFKFGLLTDQGDPAGFLAVGRLEDRLYGLRVMGMAIDANRILTDLVDPLRTALADYRP